MNLKGKITEISELQQVSDSFKKRELIVEYAENPTYPEYIKFEVHQDKTSILDNYSVGQDVEIDFNLRGRPWTDKNGKTTYFNTLVLWRIKSLGDAPTTQPQYHSPADLNNTPGEEDDLPF